MKLNRLLAAAGFDEWIETRCRPYYDGGWRGRPSIPRGVVNVTKRYLMAVAADNLGRMLKSLLGSGKRRECADGAVRRVRTLAKQTLRTLSRALQHVRTPPATVTRQFSPAWAAV